MVPSVPCKQRHSVRSHDVRWSLFLGCLIHLPSLQTQQREASRSASRCGCQEAAQPREAGTESEGCQGEQVILDGEGLRAGMCMQWWQLLICLEENQRGWMSRCHCEGSAPRNVGTAVPLPLKSCVALGKPHVQGYHGVNDWPSSRVFKQECLGVISQRVKYPKSLFLQENRDHCRSLVQMGHRRSKGTFSRKSIATFQIFLIQNFLKFR